MGYDITGRFTTIFGTNKKILGHPVRDVQGFDVCILYVFGMYYRVCLTSISVKVSRISPCMMSLKLTSEIPHSKLAATSLTSSL